MWVLSLLGCLNSSGAGASPREVCATPTYDTDLRRLTRGQYTRAVRDVLGAEIDLGLPAESGGFETWVDAQPITPSLTGAWADAAARVADAALARAPAEVAIGATALGIPTGEQLTLPSEPAADWWSMIFDGPELIVPLEIDLPSGVPDGTVWRLSVRAIWTEGYANYDYPPEIGWRIGGEWLPAAPVEGTFDTPSTLTWEVVLPAGRSTIELALRCTPYTHPGLAVDGVRLEARVDDPRVLDSEVRARLVPCLPDPDAPNRCAAEVLGPLAALAWRRDPAASEIDDLVALVVDTTAEGGSFEDGLHLAIRAVFLSPWFLFRAADVTSSDPAASRAAAQDELAERLSFLIWSSIPDAALRGCARDGALDGDGPCGLQAQVERMLADPRAEALTTEFVRQWLGLDSLAAVTDDGLHGARWSETWGLFERLRQARAPVVSALTEQTTVIDPDLAALYGVSPGAEGEAVRLPDGRLGLLGQASVLTMTSLPDRTSPVLRGAWILDRLLCDPPEPPPDGVPLLPEAAATGDVGALLADHRASPACAGCHDRIDPLGLALEGFGPRGASRGAYPDGTPVRTQAALPDGAEIDGLVELAHRLRGDPAVSSCVAQRFLAWAWARPLVEADACWVSAVSGGDGSLAGMVEAVAAEPGFGQAVAR